MKIAKIALIIVIVLLAASNLFWYGSLKECPKRIVEVEKNIATNQGAIDAMLFILNERLRGKNKDDIHNVLKEIESANPDRKLLLNVRKDTIYFETVNFIFEGNRLVRISE